MVNSEYSPTTTPRVTQEVPGPSSWGSGQPRLSNTSCRNSNNQVIGSGPGICTSTSPSISLVKSSYIPVTNLDDSPSTGTQFILPSRVNPLQNYDLANQTGTSSHSQISRSASIPIYGAKVNDHNSTIPLRRTNDLGVYSSKDLLLPKEKNHISKVGF